MLLTTVIIPAHNAASVIGAQLDALSTQVGPDVEVVVVDNRSSDALAATVAPFRSRMPIRVVAAPDRAGVSYARNTGAAAAQGDLLLFCDADDVVGPGWVAALIEALATSEVAGGVLDATTLNQASVCEAVGLTRTQSLPTTLRGRPYAFAGCMGVRRDAFRAVGGFDEAFTGHEEADLCWRIQRRGGTIGFASDAVLHYRLSADPSRVFRMQYRSGYSNAQLQAVHVAEVGRPGLRSWVLPVLRQLGQMGSLRGPETRLPWVGGLGWVLGRAAGVMTYLPPTPGGVARSVKHRVFVANKRLVAGTRPGRQAATDAVLRVAAAARPLVFDARRYPDAAFLAAAAPGGPTLPVPRVIFSVWTGTNPMSANRVAGLTTLRDSAGIDVRLVTVHNLGEFLVPGVPLHPSYHHLSLVHRADYLRCYLMHHHGGGYADLKRYQATWVPAFRLLDHDASRLAVGYNEWRSSDVALVGGRLEWDLRRHYRSVLGTCAFIMRPRSPLTRLWWDELNRRLDAAAGPLAAHPGDERGTNPGYPLAWTEVLGDILHPLELRFADRLGHDDRLKPSFNDYR